MKKLIRDRRFAAGVLALVVLIFTPLGARRSLGRAVDKVEEQFYTGTQAGGALADFYSDALRAASGLLSVGRDYEGADRETQALREAVNAAPELESGTSVGDFAAAVGPLAGAVEDLEDALLSQELGDKDAQDLDAYARAFANALAAMDRSNYNDAVERFMDETYERFPASLIGSLLGVDPPETFRLER